MKVQVEILKKKDIRDMFIIAIDELYQYNTKYVYRHCS